MDEALKLIENLISEIHHPLDNTTATNYEEAKHNLTDSSKELANSIKRLVSNKGNLIQIGTSSKEIAGILPKIVENTKAAANKTYDKNLKQQLIKDVEGLVNASKVIVQRAKDVAADVRNPISNNKLSEGFKQVTLSVSKLLDSAKHGAVGELMADEALSTIVKSIAELDAASIFAAAGQLEADVSTPGTLGDVGKELINNAKQLAAATSSLVSSTMTTQEEFGTSSKTLGNTISKLSNCAKSLGCGLTDTAAQQALLAAVKAVSIATQSLILAGKDTQRYKNEAAQKTLMKGAESVAESVSSLITLAQSTEAETAR